MREGVGRFFLAESGELQTKMHQYTRGIGDEQQAAQGHGDSVKQLKLIVDSFFRNAAACGYRECFERGLSICVQIGKEPGGGDVWQAQRDLESSETKNSMTIVYILIEVCHRMFIVKNTDDFMMTIYRPYINRRISLEASYRT